MINIILYFFKIEGGWDFRISDLARNPVVNFGEVRKTQLAKSTLLTSTLGSLESFQIFNGQFRYKRESGVRKATGSCRTYLFAVKERPAFGQSCNLGSCICSEGPALGQNTLMMMIKIIKSVTLQLRRTKTDWSGCCQMAVQGALWIPQRYPSTLISDFLTGFPYFSYHSSYPIVLTRLGGSRSRTHTVLKKKYSRE